MCAILIMGSDETEKVAALKFSKTRKNDRAKRLENDERTGGAFSHPASSVKCGRAQRLHTLHNAWQRALPNMH